MAAEKHRDETSGEPAILSRDVFSVIASRRSVTRFLPHPVPTDLLLQVIEAGRLAPSSGNIQNWHFTIVNDVEKIRAIYSHSMDQEAFLSAPAAIIVTADVEHAHRLYGMRGKRLYAVQNCAAAVQNMLLAAQALGLGSLWVGGFDEDKIIDMFGIPGNEHRPQAIVLLGYTEAIPNPKPLRPLDQMVYFNSFGNKVQRPHLILYDWATEWRMQAQKARAHLAHAKHKAGLRREEAVPDELSPSPDEQSPPQPRADRFAEAKKRLRGAIDQLKREQYREK